MKYTCRASIIMWRDTITCLKMVSIKKIFIPIILKQWHLQKHIEGHKMLYTGKGLSKLYFINKKSSNRYGQNENTRLFISIINNNNRLIQIATML